MRQIDNMSEGELDTLRLKGMLPKNWLHKFEPLPQSSAVNIGRAIAGLPPQDTWPTIEEQEAHWESHKDCPACGGTGYVIEYDEKIECPMEGDPQEYGDSN